MNTKLGKEVCRKIRHDLQGVSYTLKTIYNKSHSSKESKPTCDKNIDLLVKKINELAAIFDNSKIASGIEGE